MEGSEIALLTIVLPAKVDGIAVNRLGQLWWIKDYSDIPYRYGAPTDPDIAPLVQAEAMDYPLGPLEIDFSYKKPKTGSAGFLTSLFSMLGGVSLKASWMEQIDLAVEIKFEDYVMRSIPTAPLTPLAGHPMPTFPGTGKWFVSYAQHVATSGRFSVNYNRKKADEFGITLDKLGGAGLNYEGTEEQKVLYNFKAKIPVLFGISMYQLWVKSGKFSQVGGHETEVPFVHP